VSRYGLSRGLRHQLYIMQLSRIMLDMGTVVWYNSERSEPPLKGLVRGIEVWELPM